MRPLAKSFIARGVTLPVLLPLLKQALVRAGEEMGQPSTKQTDSRISIMTSLHRKDVRVISQSGSLKLGHSPLHARALAQSTGNPKFLTSDGTPAPLAKTGSCSFEDLVASVSKDIRSRTLLDDWQQRGVLSVADDSIITLDIQAYSPSDSEEELLHFFGENLADHIAASTQNMEHQADRLFEHDAYLGNLSHTSIKTLGTVAKDRAMSALVEINKPAFELAKTDKDTHEIKHRFRFGAYFYITEAQADFPKQATDQNPSKEETSL